MALETATLISDLVTSNPASSDGLNNTDDHLRLIKGTLKNTFPNITAAITASHSDLNNTTALLGGTLNHLIPLGTAAAPGLTPVGDTNTGIYSPGADQLAISVNGARALGIAADKTATFDGNVSITGTTSSTGALTGPGVVPIGGMIMWLTDTLPTVGTWCWANGGTLPRTGSGAALFALWGTTYGSGDGSTTFNVINMQEVSPVGKSTMGGGASPGLLSSISSGLKAALGGLFGTDTSALTSANIPSLSLPVSSGSASVYGRQITNIINGSGTTVAVDQLSSSNPGGSVSIAGVSISGQTASYTNASPTATTNMQPSRAVNFIVRIG